MSFCGKYYDNIKFKSIGGNKEHEWSHNCLSMATNFMFTHISENKVNKLFKECAVAAIVK